MSGRQKITVERSDSTPGRRYCELVTQTGDGGMRWVTGFNSRDEALEAARKLTVFAEQHPELGQYTEEQYQEAKALKASIDAGALDVVEFMHAPLPGYSVEHPATDGEPDTLIAPGGGRVVIYWSGRGDVDRVEVVR